MTLVLKTVTIYGARALIRAEVYQLVGAEIIAVWQRSVGQQQAIRHNAMRGKQATG